MILCKVCNVYISLIEITGKMVQIKILKIVLKGKHEI